MAERLYKASEVARLLKCNVQTVYRRAYKGEIESIKVGKLRRFILPDEVEERLITEE